MLSNDTGYSGAVVMADAVRFTYVAPLEPNLTLTATASAGGAVYKNPDQANYEIGSVVTLVAAPVQGWNFSGWSGDAGGAANPLTVTLLHSLCITASFTSTVPDLIVDNPQATTTGSWTAATATTTTAQTISGQARLRASPPPRRLSRQRLPPPGNYDVYVWYPTLSSSRRSAAAPYLVSYNGGVHERGRQPAERRGGVATDCRRPSTSRRARAVLFVWRTTLAKAPPGELPPMPCAGCIPPIRIRRRSSSPNRRARRSESGGAATFTATAAGTAPLSYQWRFNGAEVSGATDSTYTRSNLESGDAGTYSVVVANAVGSVTSSNAILTIIGGPINVAPAISQQPQDQNVNQGSSASFTVVATGTPAPAYQWRFNGANINGATDSSYTRSSAQPADAGSYSVVVTNIAGTATSADAILGVNVPPEITAQPQSLSVTAGSNVTFSVTATGTAPLTYQWRFNGADLANATTLAYICNNAQTTNAGTYSVVVSNIAGTATSADAVLAVVEPIPLRIDRISLILGGRIQLDVSGEPGHYAIDAGATLGAWTELTNFTTTGSAFQYQDPETNQVQRFYRIRLIP